MRFVQTWLAGFVYKQTKATNSICHRATILSIGFQFFLSFSKTGQNKVICVKTNRKNKHFYKIFKNL